MQVMNWMLFVAGDKKRASDCGTEYRVIMLPWIFKKMNGRNS
jgi:hypothetical protein